ncbi:hypothetical protein POTOM_060852 [Populus tomentosa]|uniref:Uncharacterized protein n=1 Tax=Populus tomentosa TaxID=118781 RepID=A0A8X7XR17_POPTO|nr:hypothetical protein POTOM_060852 [Populus tomentosa]
MVGSAILMMFVAFIYAVTIALLGSHDAWLKSTITVEVFMGFYVLAVFVVIPWTLPFKSIPNLQGMLLHYFYYDDLHQQRGQDLLGFPTFKRFWDRLWLSIVIII